MNARSFLVRFAYSKLPRYDPKGTLILNPYEDLLMLIYLMNELNILTCSSPFYFILLAKQFNEDTIYYFWNYRIIILLGYLKYWIKIDEESWMSRLAESKMTLTVFKGVNFYGEIFSDSTKGENKQPSVTLLP